MTIMYFNRTAFLLVLSLSSMLGHAPAHAQSESDGWEYRLTPYLWLPRIDGTLKYDVPERNDGGQTGEGSPNVSVGPTDWLDLLNYGLLLNGSARKDKFSISSDIVYLSMTSKNDGRITSVDRPDLAPRLPVDASLNVDTRTDLDGVIFSLSLGYAIRETERSTVDLYGGVRYLGVDVDTRWDLAAAITGPNNEILLPSQGSIGVDKDILDAVAGFRGEFKVGSGCWSFPWAIDVGAGDSDLTWNALAGLSCRF